MEPKYRIVADELRREIAAGVYADGQTLMTEAELKQRFEVSRQTVRQAISLLEDDGLVLRRRGSGTYVTHGPRKRVGDMTIGVITTYITDYIFPSIVRGIESVLSTENCFMSLSATYNRTDRERALLTRLMDSPVDGLIVEGTKTALPNPNIALYERLWERNIPVVFINGYYPQLKRNIHVVTDDEAGGRLAASTLIERGFTRIGGIFKSDDMQGRLRYQGYAAALEATGLRADDALVSWFTTEDKPAFLDEQSGGEYLNRLIAGADSVVCYNDEIALALMRRLEARGVRVPQDISVISFDNSAYADICHPALTSLSHPKDAFGRSAAHMLLNMLGGARVESLSMSWELVMRDSVK